AAAGYFGGWFDAVVSRLVDLVMTFPLLLFLLMLGTAASPRLRDVTLGGLFNQGVLMLILLIGAFTWFYPARIVRAEVLSLRRREFVEAAVSVGASDARILSKHLVPALAPTLIAYGAVLMATNVMLDAGVIFFKIPSEPASFLVDPKVATQAQIKAARHTLGADRPVHVQFAKYVWRVAHGDFGRSWRTYYVYAGEVVPGVPVSHILRDAAG